MKRLPLCSFALLLATLLAPPAVAQQHDASTSANNAPPDTAEAAKLAAKSADPEIAVLERQIQQLSDLLASQSVRIEAQEASLKAERERILALESELTSLKIATSPLISSAAANPSSAAPAAPAPPIAPAVIAAIAPVRALPVGAMPRDTAKPGFTLGPVSVTPYGFLKATFIHDSSSPDGDDFPLPGFLTDTGPTAAPEFHIKARSSRIGTNLLWADPSSRLTLTGKIEIDFEGNFSRADNRNLSSIRSSMPSIRLAYGRIDYRVGEHDTFSALFGQDWTPFGSSTLPPILETTGYGIGFGGLWERDPQMRFGWTHDFGRFRLLPEFAVVLPASGETPAATDLIDQLGYGERQGADSDRPDVQARVVFQWQLDHAPGVVPAQIIFSGEQGRREAIVLASAVPSTFAAAFPRGAMVGSNSDGWTAETQLPTRYATLIGKFYDGSDLRWFFGGQLFSNYNDTAGLTGLATASSIDGSSTVDFGLRNGIPVIAPQRPVRAAGGFASLGLPLSRIFGADPNERSMGWTTYLTYGTDQAKTRDLVRLEPDGSRGRSDMSVGTIYYKLNSRITFAFEESLYRTRADDAAAGLPLFMGMPAHEWRDLRSEGGTIFFLLIM
jgi:hypothetical protein